MSHGGDEVKKIEQLASRQELARQQRPSRTDLVYALQLTVACAVSYWLTTHSLAPFVGKDADFLGGMWAVVATIFVLRDTNQSSISAAFARFIATCVSFALCLIYLLLFPFQAWGMAILIGVGSVIMMLLGRHQDIVTTGITTTVVMVVAAMSPESAWQQPLLRLLDTIIGMAVGPGCARIGSVLFRPRKGVMS